MSVDAAVPLVETFVELPVVVSEALVVLIVLAAFSTAVAVIAPLVADGLALAISVARVK